MAAEPGQIEPLEPAQGIPLQGDLSRPLLGQAQQRIEAQHQLPCRDGFQQLQGRHGVLVPQHLTQGALQKCSGAAAVGGGDQCPDLIQDPFPGPAAQKLQTEASLFQQWRLQQPNQPFTAGGIQERQPDSQVTPAAFRVLAPGFQFGEIHAELEAIQLQLKLLSSGAGKGQCNQQTGNQSGGEPFRLAAQDRGTQR